MEQPARRRREEPAPHFAVAHRMEGETFYQLNCIFCWLGLLIFMAYREKGRAATTLTNDKHPVYGNGHSKPSNDSKRDRYRLRELTEGIREVAMNIDHIPAGALEELEEAIKLLATSRSKVQHVIVNEPIKSTSVNGRVPSTNQMRITANQLESEIEQLRADVLKLSNEADSLKVINTNRLNDL